MSEHRLSHRLDALLGTLLPAQGLVSIRIVDSYDPRAAFERYLLGLHWFMRASHPLMVAAGGAFDRVGNSPLAEYCYKHADEEKDHDRWLLEDLAVAGADVDALLSSSVAQCVAEMVGAQYYWLLHAEPRVFFGYVYALESRPPSTMFISRLREVGHLPRASTHCLEHHSEVDSSHTSELSDIIDEHVPEPHVQLALEENAVRTFEQTVHVMQKAIGRYLQPQPRLSMQ